MKKHHLKLAAAIALLASLAGGQAEQAFAQSSTQSAADAVPPVPVVTLDEVLGVRSSTTVQGARSQAKIDQISEETRSLLQDFKTTMKIVEGLRIHNRQQRKLISNQEKELLELDDSIKRATIIERQIGPLVERMIDNLEKFVELDIPFLIDERRNRIAFLKEVLERNDVTIAEKFNQVMQAYQVENTYGTTIEAYTDSIELEGKSRQVDVLKWGRVTLVFQTPDQEITGVWDNKARNWVILDDDFRTGVRDGLRIARKTQTADLVLLPVQAPGQ